MTQDQIRASFQIKENSITPDLIDYSGSAPTDEQSLVYDAGTEKFAWATISGISDHTHTVLPAVTVTGVLTANDDIITTGDIYLQHSSLGLPSSLIWRDNSDLEHSIIRSFTLDTTNYFRIDLDDVDSNDNSIVIYADSLATSRIDLYANTYSGAMAHISCLADSDLVVGERSKITLSSEQTEITGTLVLNPTSSIVPTTSGAGCLYIDENTDGRPLRYFDYQENNRNIIITDDLDYIVSGGWTKSMNTWTYASASTFTITGDVTSIYTKGTKIKWTQTTVKYGVVSSSSYSAPNTTVTIIVNTSYTIANAAISNNYYSYLDSPFGFPSAFSYSPTWTSASNPQPAIGNGSLSGRYIISGKSIRLIMSFTAGTTTTFGTGVWSFSLPVTSAGGFERLGTSRIPDSSTGTQYVRLITILTGATTMTYFIEDGTSNNQLTSAVPMTWATGDALHADIEYEY